MNHPIDRQRLQGLTCGNKTDYQRFIQTCKAALNLSWSTTKVLDILSVQYSTDIIKTAEEILLQYRKNYVERLDINQRQYVDLNSPVYQCAAFTTAAIKLKVRL